jgi:hypothetical protein
LSLRPKTSFVDDLMMRSQFANERRREKKGARECVFNVHFQVSKLQSLP